MVHESEKQLGEIGLLRLEGKNYSVKDGNVLNIRFNVHAAGFPSSPIGLPDSLAKLRRDKSLRQAGVSKKLR